MLALTLSRKITYKVMLCALGAEIFLGMLWWSLSARAISSLSTEHQIAIHFSVMGLMTLIITFVSIYSFSYLITSPLVRLENGLGRLQDGQRNVTVDFRRETELHHLATAFNQVAEHLDNLIDEGEAQQTELDNLQDAYTRDQATLEKVTTELKAANDNLLKHASEVGIAKMVIGLMHNIGNALTPAIIDTTTSMRHLQNSALRHHLAPALKPLKDIIDKTDVLEHDVKYRLTQIITMLPDSIQEEYSKVIISLERISERHAHIEEIINLQLRYAQVNSNCQTFKFDLLVRDALKMLKELINKYDIKVITHFATLPDLCWDEPRLLQILVNVIKNGCEAMMDSDNRRILNLETLLDPNEPEYLLFTVEDNGIGFDEAEKEQMFTFGYSTKNRRPGFGLHTYANDLIAQKGSIEGVSDGPGKGALFTIRLPFEPD